MGSSSDSQFVRNPHLKLLDGDLLFHIGIKTGDQNLRKLFGDVKVHLFVRLLELSKTILGYSGSRGSGNSKDFISY